jgi:serine protease Do
VHKDKGVTMLLTRYWSHLVAAGCLGLAVTAGVRPVAAEAAARQEAGGSAPDATRGNLGSVIKRARDQVFPALVNIKVITVDYWGGKELKGAGVGSGTIISPQGHVLTNYHVVRNGRKFVCTLSDKHEVTAELTGEDPLTDLAVLKLTASELVDLGPLPVARFGDSDALEVGDTVMAMGSPLALSRSVTLGIVSNTERILAGGDDDAGELYFDRDQRTGVFNRWIQHDASISPGNSGGPLVNLDGEVVGVNTRGTNFGGDMGFAIPANVAHRISAQLIEQGEVRRSWVDMSFKPIKKTGLSEGVLLSSVIEGGPADRAGLEAGDVVLEIDREPVTVWFPEEVPPLLKRLAEYPVGSSISIAYQREGERHVVELVTELLKKDRGDEAAFRAWGLVAMDITERMARQRRLDNTRGVLVGSVASGSPAQLAEPSLSGGDVILAIAGEPTDDLATFVERYGTIMEAEDTPKYLLIEFDRGGRNQVTLLKPKPDKDVEPPREVPKAWIGIAVQPVVAKLASYLGHPRDVGFRITRVYPGTLADREADLVVGDVILALNGDSVRPRGMQDSGLFHRRVRRLEIGEVASLTILRDGAEREVPVRLERTRITPQEAGRERNRDFELTVREVTFFDRDGNRWDDDIHGVIVASVESAGWAGLAGTFPGDLIQRIDEQRIRDLDDFRSAMEQIAEREPQRVVFVVLRGVRTYFLFLEPEWSPAPAAGAED